MITYPVRRGTTLVTPQTKRWTQDQWSQNELVENCMVFCNFTAEDQGAGRLFVANCANPQAAAELVIVLNDGMRAIKALEEIKKLPGPSLNMSDVQRILDENK